jgi:hypothetical protein
MADKGSKTKARPKREQQSVLGSLPATRPERLGRPREVTIAKVQTTGPRPAPARPKRSRAAAPERAAAPPKSRATHELPHGPAAVTAGSPPLERAHASEPPPKPIGGPKGTEIVTTAIQATGELARIGLTVGGQVLKRAVVRLPRP